MALEIISVRLKGKKPKHRHVTTVGLMVNNTVIRFSVKTVRKIITEGTVEFYCLTPDGKQVPVRRYKCRCGAKTIHTNAGDAAGDLLSRLPICGASAELLAIAASAHQPRTSTPARAPSAPNGPARTRFPTVKAPRGHSESALT